MSDFLTRRGAVWHFVRRVPIEFAEIDARGIVRHTTRIKIADDRRAARVALKLNEELEHFWHVAATGQGRADTSWYDEARRRARTLGYDYVDAEQLLAQPLERLEALVIKGVANDSGARAALLGTEKRPAFFLSRLFEEFEAATRDEIKGLSPDQLRIWRNSRVRAVSRFVEVVGDKPVTEITDSDGIDYTEWWRERIIRDEADPKTANKDIGQLSRMLKAMSIRRRLNLPDIFKELRRKGEVEKSRVPFETDFIQSPLLATSALDKLNEEARHVLY